MELKIFSVKKEQLEGLRKLSRETGISQSLLIRRAIDNLLRAKKKLKEKAL